MRLVYGSDEVDAFRGTWIRLRYSQSFRGQPVRPLLRLIRGSGETDVQLLPAAVFGRARWLGPGPADLARIELLADLDEPGQIRIDELRATTAARLFAEAVRHRPAAALVGALRWPLRNGRGRMLTLQGLLDHAALRQIGAFAETRTRPLEPNGLDAWVEAPVRGTELTLVLVPGENSPLRETPQDEEGTGPGSDAAEALGRTLASLTPAAGRVRLVVALPEGTGKSATVRAALAAAGCEIRTIPRGVAPGHAALALAGEAATPWVGLLRLGDELSPEAIPALLDHVARRPHLAILYADSVVRDEAGRLAAPELKPDWSPAFLDGLDYVGRPVLIRRERLAAAARAVDPADPHPWWTLLRRAGAGLSRQEAGHLRRVLLRHPAEPAAHAGPRLGATAGGRHPMASIVIPTRDRLDLLRRAVDSLRCFTTVETYELVVVDNGSREPETLAYLAGLRAGRNTIVLDEPGPFNFSHLANQGVAAARGDVVVLLNNDCEILDGDWLPGLVDAASRPEIGAVGARLLYANDTLQHAGIGIGLGGEAGHRDRKLPRDHPGHLGRLCTTHEVSAVTAACLAVRRARYLEVGGFDTALAVAFNDVDFCLRLDAAGYRNLLVPGVVLRHAESASRGRDGDGAKRSRFRAEAALFASRWQGRVLADPYGHPLFALDRFADTLA